MVIFISCILVYVRCADIISTHRIYRRGELDGCNYTIYVDRNEEEETMVADVFMPVKE